MEKREQDALERKVKVESFLALTAGEQDVIRRADPSEDLARKEARKRGKWSKFRLAALRMRRRLKSDQEGQGVFRG